VEVDSLFVTALLTIIGFSVHDTIVVFDRIRENLRLNPGEPTNAVINFSIMQTIARSINTSLTVLLTLLALFLFGGFSIRNFALALLVGVISGTYSSIFNASQLVSLWQEMRDRWRQRGIQGSTA
jgi:preprotein translocase subunit SecF